MAKAKKPTVKIETPKQRKIAIVGTSPTSCLNAPYNDPTWEIWTIGKNLGSVPRVDTFFEIHDRDCLIKARVDPKYFESMKLLGSKLIIGQEWPDFPDATIYPKDRIVKEFGKYFTSSIALMIALAIIEGATEIGLWGVDMTADKDEYGWQKACCEFYLGLAFGRGVKLHIAKESPLLRVPRIYGLEEDRFSAELTERWMEILDEIPKAQEQVTKANANLNRLEAMRDLLRDQITRWG